MKLIIFFFPYAENENEKDSDDQVEVMEHSGNEISKKNPDKGEFVVTIPLTKKLSPSKITDYFQLHEVKDNKRSENKLVPILSKSQGSSSATINENNEVITDIISDNWQSIDNRIITPNDAKVATSTLVGQQKSTEKMPASMNVESQNVENKNIVKSKRKQQIIEKKNLTENDDNSSVGNLKLKISLKRKTNPNAAGTQNDSKKARITEKNSGIFSCIIQNSKCEMKFHNDQDLLNHSLQFHKNFLQTLWMEDNDNEENDNDQEKFEKFCKEIVIELLLAEYKSPAKRLKTFENWPNKSVNPEDLANAGLLFTGSEDNAKCVYCGNDIGKMMEEPKKYSTSSLKKILVRFFWNIFW